MAVRGRDVSERSAENEARPDETVLLLTFNGLLTETVDPWIRVNIENTDVRESS